MRETTKSNRVPGSFRDPSGFLFTREGTLYRQVNEAYQTHFEKLMSSGLYDVLTAKGLLVNHVEVEIEPCAAGSYKIIRPEIVPFISHPYEWCFSELKDAALTTLKAMGLALEHGMVLKDASAYNVQFTGCRPVIIDTLSFETYREGEPWVAYRQFCQHFLAPLALMSKSDIRLSQLLRVHIDGIPLDLASVLLPARTRLKGGLLLHIHLHGKAQAKYAGSQIDTKSAERKFSKQALLGLLDSLETAVRKLEWTPAGTEWADYYEDNNNYTFDALELKKELVGRFVKAIMPSTVWDMGANTGVFSRAASHTGASIVSFDIDPAAVERNYRRCRDEKRNDLLPLVMDLTNPSPDIGWSNRERASLIERGPAGMALALALVHHLAISNNLPLEMIADFFADICDCLVIEWVPKSDSQVKRLLSSREDIFDRYEQREFERAFKHRFTLADMEKIDGSERTLYLMKKAKDG